MRTRSTTACSVLLAGVWLCTACGPSLAEHSGKDMARGKAVKIKLDQAYDDRVSAPEGDNTDWKTFTLEYPTTVTLKVYWDSPNKLDATVMVADHVNVVKGTIRHNPGQREELAGPVTLDEGTWFVRVRAYKGSSVYTLEVLQGEGSTGGDGGTRPTW